MCLRSEDAKKINKQNDIDMKNKIIAEFMGVKTIAMDELYSILRQNRENGFIHTPQAYTIEELKYHKSWDWLIPVIKKIDAYANEEMSFNEFNEYRDKYVFIHDLSVHNDIKDIYNQVVEFIKNQNN